MLDGKLKGLVGNTLVGAAAVAYLGPLTLSYRQELVAQWENMCRQSQVPISESFDLIHNMAEPNQVSPGVGQSGQFLLWRMVTLELECWGRVTQQPRLGPCSAQLRFGAGCCRHICDLKQARVRSLTSLLLRTCHFFSVLPDQGCESQTTVDVQ